MGSNYLHDPDAITEAAVWEGRPPHPTPRPKSGSPQWAGLQYERKFGEYLTAVWGDEVRLGPWFRYVEAGKARYCQPDALVVPADPERPIIILEVKLTYTPIKAARKMRNLYQPVVEATWQRPTILVQVCKFLNPRARCLKILTGVGELLTLPTPPLRSSAPTSKATIHTLNWRPR